MKKIFNKFFAWYEKYTEQNTLIATALFITQLVHLTWLSLHVVASRLGDSLWDPTGFGQTILVLVDYVEIPAIIATSILYIHLLRKGQDKRKSILFLILLNSQWLHIFWITDEFVLDTIHGTNIHTTILPSWLAWLAIMIDYLELPVIYDTLKRSFRILGRRLSG
jgi:hypothetical protein